MSLLYVVIFITTLSIGSSLSNDFDINEKCQIFKHGLNITWPNTDVVKSVSSGYIFNATCGCTIGIPFWSIFINGSNNGLSCGIYFTHNKHKYRPCNISITESTLLLCYNDHHQYSKPIFISVTQKAPKSSVPSSFPTPSPSLVPTCPISSTSLLSSSLLSNSPSHFFSQSLSSQSLSPLSPFPSITTDAITSSTTTIISPRSSSITITTVFSTVIVTITPTITPTCNIKATTTTSSNTSLSTNPFNIKTAEQTALANECTTTLLAAVVPSGVIVIILLVLLVTAMILCIVVKKHSCTKIKSTTIFQNTIPNDQL